MQDGKHWNRSEGDELAFYTLRGDYHWLMTSNRRKAARQKDLTSRYLGGDFDEKDLAQGEEYSHRSKGAQQSKILRTAALRIEEQSDAVDLAALPTGEVIQVYSLYCDVLHEGCTYLCVVRKTMVKVRDAPVIVGDRVKFRTTGVVDESGRPEAVLEQVLPRQTVLMRANSFNAMEQHPIVANAEQMLIVASLRQPLVKWGLIDRMIVAANSGGLRPVVCLNKIDLGRADAKAEAEWESARQTLAHYRTMDIGTLEASVSEQIGLDELRQVLRDRVTVLAGHSGVGKSSLIRAIQPSLDLRIGEVSHFTDKGRHTTSSAKRYALDFGGLVIDTPGVKLFGLWDVKRGTLIDYFPDVQNDTAPKWRRESYERIAESLPR